MSMGLIIFLLLLGDALVLAELLFIPGTILTGLLGLGSIAGSCYLAYSHFSPSTSIIIFVVNIALLVVLTIILLRAKTWRKLSLETKINDSYDKKPQERGVAVGQQGVASTRLAPIGKVTIGGETMEAVSQEGYIDVKEVIEVSKIEDNKIFVKRINNN